MSNSAKLGVGLAAVAIIAAGGAFLLNQGGGGDGFDVTSVDCDGIAAARTAVDAELETKLSEAETAYSDAMEAASDAYWETRRSLENTFNECMYDALIADPCKDAFENSYKAGQTAINDPTDANVETYENAKQVWKDCQNNPPKEDTYEGKKAKCEADLANGDATAKQTRQTAEGAAASARTQAINDANSAHKSKHAALDAFEEECNRPAPKVSVGAGGITTGGTGTVVQSASPACTGSFSGYDPETQAEINRLRSLYNQAVAGGKYEGLGGANSLSAKMNELRTDMAAGPRKCQTDSDCGDTTKVCCSETEIGWVYCDSGECAAEKQECENEEICSGKPAQCVAPADGAESVGIFISDVIVIGAQGTNKLRQLNLQPASADSARYEITGNIPGWLDFSQVGGQLPDDSDVTIDRGSFTAPGTYIAAGHITIYDADGNLINTIPLTVSITALPGADEPDNALMIDGSGGDDLIGAEGSDTLIGSPDDDLIIDGGDGNDLIGGGPSPSLYPPAVSFVYDHAHPQCPLPITPVHIDGPPGANWSLQSEPPIWLDFPGPTSGIVPASVPMQFPCMLDRYENQTQYETIEFKIDTEIIGLDLKGEFTNF
ncbi:hypothetical protein KKA15_02735 [Patescibacteria group bacterium]|nr:hypothetical protein [Patescibacteria group bacterium]